MSKAALVNRDPAIRQGIALHPVNRPKPGVALQPLVLPVTQPVPEWLVVPMKLLVDARSPQHRPRARLRFLGTLAAEVDRIYATLLPDLAISAQQGDRIAGSLLETLPAFIVPLLDEASAIYHEEVGPALSASQLVIAPIQELTDAQVDWLRRTYMTHIFPLLTPLAVDPGRPFPYIVHGTLNLLVELGSAEAGGAASNSMYACVRVPRFLPRLIPVPAQPDSAPGVTRWPMKGKDDAFYPRYGVWIEDVVGYFVCKLFPGMEVIASHRFRVIRMLEGTTLDGERTAAQRQAAVYSRVTRLDAEDTMPDPLVSWLTYHLETSSQALLRGPSPLGMADLLAILEALPKRPTSRWLRWMHWWGNLFFGHIKNPHQTRN